MKGRKELRGFTQCPCQRVKVFVTTRQSAETKEMITHTVEVIARRITGNLGRVSTGRSHGAGAGQSVMRHALWTKTVFLYPRRVCRNDASSTISMGTVSAISAAQLGCQEHPVCDDRVVFIVCEHDKRLDATETTAPSFRAVLETLTTTPPREARASATKCSLEQSTSVSALSHATAATSKLC